MEHSLEEDESQSYRVGERARASHVSYAMLTYDAKCGHDACGRPRSSRVNDKALELRQKFGQVV